jgi:hypothetical protein
MYLPTLMPITIPVSKMLHFLRLNYKNLCARPPNKLKKHTMCQVQVLILTV